MLPITTSPFPILDDSFEMTSTSIDPKVANFFFKLRRQFAGVDAIEVASQRAWLQISNPSQPPVVETQTREDLSLKSSQPELSINGMPAIQ